MKRGLFDEESGPCSAFVVCKVYRNSSQFILQFTTISIRNATSTHVIISRPTVSPLSTNGAVLARRKGKLHCP